MGWAQQSATLSLQGVFLPFPAGPLSEPKLPESTLVPLSKAERPGGALMGYGPALTQILAKGPFTAAAGRCRILALFEIHCFYHKSL